jgi:hypothetical protein
MTSRDGILLKPPELMLETDLVRAGIGDAVVAPWRRQ